MFNCWFQKRLKDIAIIVPGAFLTFAGYSIYEGNEKFYREYVMPFTHKFFDAETAHRLGVLAAKYNIVPRKQKTPDSPILVSVLVVKTTIYWSTGHSGHRYKTKSCWFECNQALFWSFDIACSVRRLQRIITIQLSSFSLPPLYKYYIWGNQNSINLLHPAIIFRYFSWLFLIVWLISFFSNFREQLSITLEELSAH